MRRTELSSFWKTITSTTDSGTGIVHQAPAFGEDDFRVLRAAGIQVAPCPVDMEGQFTSEVTDFTGMHVKEADKHIIRHLKNEGRPLYPGSH